MRKTIAKYGTASSANVGRLDTVEDCVNHLVAAGFEKIKTATEELGYYHADLDAYWDEVMSSMRRIPLDKLDPATAEKVRQEHLEEMKEFLSDEGLWRPVPTLFAIGLKSG